ncbi:hypothetical protein H2248_012475 [Termitomyces sp. 'cryptogamus']|nr:hypothetical protein H2248_012475 [Termitomyces sp. 'cryptogamus']
MKYNIYHRKLPAEKHPQEDSYSLEQANNMKLDNVVKLDAGEILLRDRSFQYVDLWGEYEFQVPPRQPAKIDYERLE